jgi:hypothetical protein
MISERLTVTGRTYLLGVTGVTAIQRGVGTCGLNVVLAPGGLRTDAELKRRHGT